jgi:ATP-binding cassette subfamily B protein IrtA
LKSMRSLYKKLFHYVPDKRILAYFSMALSAAAVCSYMGAYWFLWQSIVSILVIPVYEKAMYDAIIVVILMLRISNKSYTYTSDNQYALL